MDADIWGYSIPNMLGAIFPPIPFEGRILPSYAHGVKVISMDYFVKKDEAVIWRGPMLHKAIEQFLYEVIWQDIDFLLIDMPPGTGDTQLTFSQEIKMDGVIIVSTPQEIALQDVKRGIRMFDKLGVKIIGLIDNMSHFVGDDGKKYPIFGEGGVKRTAEEFKKEFLGEIPINPEVGKQGDRGTPIVESKPDHKISKIYLDFAKKIKSTYL